MATVEFIGAAQARANVWTVTIANTWATNDTATLTINNKSLTLTVGAATTTAGVAAAITAMVNGDTVVGTETRSDTGSNVNEFKDITAATVSSTVTLTSDNPGIPFTITASESTAGTGTCTVSETTTNKGPEDALDANNWQNTSTLAYALPSSSDTIIFARPQINLRYNLTALAAIATSTVRQMSTFTGEIGLPDTNALGGYAEYRTKHFQLDGCTLLTLEAGDGGGSSLSRYNFLTSQATVRVDMTGQSSVAGAPALELLGTHASNSLTIRKGSVGMSFYPYDAASSWTTIQTGSESSPSTDAVVYAGSGVTLTTITQYGGIVTVNSAVTTHNMTAGTFRILKTATMGTTTVDGGTYYWESSGTMTSGTFRNRGTLLEAIRDPRARTATNLSVTKGAVLNDPNKTIVFSNAVVMDRASLLASDIGSAFSVQRS